MKRVAATKEFRWEAAHRLMGFGGTPYVGKCRHVHGHSYKAEITVEKNIISDDSIGRAVTPQDTLNLYGFVIDFDDLKKIKTWIDDQWDHAMIVHREDSEMQEFLLKQKNRMFIMPQGYSPSVESMAMFLFRVSSDELNTTEYKVVKVKVWETSTCFAEAMA